VPLISPSAYFACAEAGVPVIQTLHNYRFLCPASTFLRQGQNLRRVRHLHSISQRLARLLSGFCQRKCHACADARKPAALGTWQEKVACYIARTEFARKKFIEGGLPAGTDRGQTVFRESRPWRAHRIGDTVLVLGRLSPEKGTAKPDRGLGTSGRRRAPANRRQRASANRRRWSAAQGAEAEVERRGLSGVKVLGRVPKPTFWPNEAHGFWCFQASGMKDCP